MHMPLPITSIAATVLTFIFTNITMSIIRHRKELSTTVNEGARATYARLLNAHGNFVYFAPLPLILLAVLEIKGVEASILIGLAGLLVLGRAAHASGILKTHRSVMRPIGLYTTLLMFVSSSFILLSHTYEA